jgi:hypothetical protein
MLLAINEKKTSDKNSTLETKKEKATTTQNNPKKFRTIMNKVNQKDRRKITRIFQEIWVKKKSPLSPSFFIH